MKKNGIKTTCIFWGVLGILVASTYWTLIYFDPRHIIQGRTTFLLGLIWIWNGAALLFHVNPVLTEKFERKYQIKYAAVFACMGVAWVLLSFSGFADEAFPMIIVTLPFLVIGYIIFIRAKKESSSSIS